MELQQLRTTGDTVLVHIPERLEETITVAGRQLWFDPTWREMETKHLRGVLVAVPEKVGASYLLTRKGFAGGRVNVDAIQDVLAVGDVVYSDWTVSEDHGKLKLADFEVPGVGGVYRATLNQLVARVREGVLEPFGSYVFCKEVWPADIEEVELPGFPGKMRLRVSPTSGLTLGSEDIPALPWQGEVTHVGLPLRGQPCRVKVGDRVVFDKAMCGKDKRPMKLKLEGVEYLCIRQDYIAAVLEEVPTVAEMARQHQADVQEIYLKSVMVPVPHYQEGDVIPLTTGVGLANQPVNSIPCEKGLTDAECDNIVQHFFPGAPAGEWKKLPTVPTGFSFDIAKIETAFKSIGETPNLTQFLKHHGAGEPYIVGGIDLIQLVKERGGITANTSPPTWGKYNGNGDFMTTTEPPFKRLVTTCCGAESYTRHPNGYMEGGEIDYCKECKQVAHLVPLDEFSNNKPAA